MSICFYTSDYDFLFLFITHFPTLAGTKFPLFSFSPPPNFVQMILSAASEKWVASSGSTPEVLRSLLLSFCSLPSTSFIIALFIEISVKRHLSPLKRTSGRFSRSSLKIKPHSRYLSDCGGSIPLWACLMTSVIFDFGVKIGGYHQIE